MNDSTTGAAGNKYVMSLYVIGMSPASLLAIKNLKSICESYLKGQYLLEVTDILKHPDCMYENNLIASPTLIKRSPAPVKKLVGDLSNRDRVLEALSIATEK